jgi:hypothetical protein
LAGFLLWTFARRGFRRIALGLGASLFRLSCVGVGGTGIRIAAIAIFGRLLIGFLRIGGLLI